MLLRVAAWWLAAFLVAVEVPAFADIAVRPAADANVSAAKVAIEAPMGQSAAGSDMPSAALQDAAAAQQDRQQDIKASTATSNDAETQAEALAPVALAITTAIQPEGQKHDQADGGAAIKLAALETPATTPPAITVPQPARGELPQIDTAFRFNVLPVDHGGVLAKWNGVKVAMRAESEVFARCRTNMESCPVGAKRFLAIVDQGRMLSGRAQVGVINRAINMAIEPVSDMTQWGVPDRWSAPLETFTTGKGDCEDYAIAKYVALIEAGIAAQDLKLVIIRNTAANEDHAVTAVRLDGAWIILDNRWLRLVEDTAMQQAVPLYALGADGVRQYLPDVRVGQRRAPPAPASIQQ